MTRGEVGYLKLVDHSGMGGCGGTTDLEMILDEHRQWLAYLGRAEATIYQRGRHVHRLIAAGVDPLEATSAELLSWAIGMVGRMSIESRATEISHCRGWFVWLSDAGWRADNAAAGLVRPKVPAAMPRPVSTDEARRAIMAAAPRQRVMLALAAGGGLRCAEIAGLRWRDVQRDPMPVLIVTGKGRKTRAVPASKTVMSALDAVRNDAEIGHKVWVLPRLDDRPGPIPPHLVSIHGAKALRSAGVDATMHRLRHTFATQLYAATQDIVLVAELLGHTSILTTQRYVGLARAHAASAVARVDEALRRGIDAEVAA